MMQELIVTVGRPASGKTRYATELVKQHPVGKIGRVNRDFLRLMSHGAWLGDPEQEEQVTDAQLAIIGEYLKLGRDVVADDTNLLGRASIDHWLWVAKQYPGTSLTVVDFLNVPLEVCIERNSYRIPGVSYVPEPAIHAMWRKFRKGMFPDDDLESPRSDEMIIAQFRAYVASFDIKLVIME